MTELPDTAQQPRRSTRLLALLMFLTLAGPTVANVQASAWKTDILTNSFQITEQSHDSVQQSVDDAILVSMRAAERRETVAEETFGKTHLAHRMFRFTRYRCRTDTTLLNTQREITP